MYKILSLLMFLLCISCSQEPKYFGDYICTEDCSGHIAGYEWAESKGIINPDDCGGNSQSFIEGCLEYSNSH